MKRLSLLLMAFLAIAAAGVMVAASSGLLGPPQLKGTVYPEPRPTPDFTLTNAQGQPVALHDFSDKVVLLYFGYTFCPDVCPTTMAELAKVQRQVDDEGRSLQVIMVSVDPQRDTPQVVQEYVSSFHPTFIGLSGTEAQIAAAAEPLGIYYEAQEGSAESGYVVDHTARVFLVDQQGELHLSYSFATPAEDIASDLRVLMD